MLTPISPARATLYWARVGAMEEQKDKSGGGAAATIEDNTFEALEKDFQEVADRRESKLLKEPYKRK